MVSHNTPDDVDADALWAYVVQGVEPLKGQKNRKKPMKDSHKTKDDNNDHNSTSIAEATEVAKGGPNKGAKTPRVKPHILPHEANKRAEITPAKSGKGLDASTRQKLERGQMNIEAILDLHAQTYESAQEGVKAFLLNCWRGRMRCVLVITGKGKGVLKTGFAHWIEQEGLRNIVLHVAPAQNKHGGGGAFYVLLRRRREG